MLNEKPTFVASVAAATVASFGESLVESPA
jgi:hypothetical protein